MLATGSTSAPLGRRDRLSRPLAGSRFERPEVQPALEVVRQPERSACCLARSAYGVAATSRSVRTTVNPAVFTWDDRLKAELPARKCVNIARGQRRVEDEIAGLAPGLLAARPSHGSEVRCALPATGSRIGQYSLPAGFTTAGARLDDDHVEREIRHAQ